MAGIARLGVRRGTFILALLLICATLIAAASPASGERVPIAVDVPVFATQQAGIEGTVPNFWGPAIEGARQELYADAPGGTRRVQYFDKARMEDAATGVTNGLLTVELISGQRQMGDNRFATVAPCALPVVGDPDNLWPSYSSLNATVFPQHSARSSAVVDTTYEPDGTFTHDTELGMKAGAAAGGYVSDPGGRYAHNIPAGFWRYLNGLPVPWQSAMGFPLTEAFWTTVRVRGLATRVLVQPFERRVLSYTSDNAPGFTVEMGNIGQHYYRWRYPLVLNDASPAASDTATTVPATATTAATTAVTTTAVITTGTATGTTRLAPITAMPIISGVRFGLASSTTATLSFQTDVPATTRILFGTASHSYQAEQDIGASPMQDHHVTLAGLTPKTKYYFILRAITDGGTGESKEGYFATAPANATLAATAQDVGGNPAPEIQPTATVRLARNTSTVKPAKDTATPLPTETPHSTKTPYPTETPRPTSTPKPDTSVSPTATSTPRSPTATATAAATPTATATPTAVPPTRTPTSVPPTNTPTPTPTSVPDVQVAITQFAVVSDGSTLDIVQTNAVTITITLTDLVRADTQRVTISPHNWTLDAANARITATDAGTILTLRGRQNPVTVQLDVSVPLRDHDTLAFTTTQTVIPVEYQAGKTYTVSKGIASVPKYHAEIQFTVSQV